MVVDQSMNKEKMPDFAMMVSGYCGYKQTILLIHFAVKTIDKQQADFSFMMILWSPNFEHS
jgi:hypothetical protein